MNHRDCLGPMDIFEAFCGGGGSPKGDANAVRVKEGGGPVREGNGGNIGLDLLARLPHSSQKPRIPEEGAYIPPPLVPALPRQDVKKTQDNSELSTTAVSPFTPDTVHVSASPGGAQSKRMITARSFGLLLKGEEEFDESDSVADDTTGDHAEGTCKNLPETSTMPRSPLQRRESAKNILDHNAKGNMNCGIFGFTSAMAFAVRFKLMNAFPPPYFSSPESTECKTSDGTDTAQCSTKSSGSSWIARLSGKKRKLTRRNSQFSYAESAQTAIVFDWDDTLFPTTYLLDELRLDHKKPLRMQRLPNDLLEEVEQILSELEASVLKLLKEAHRRGKIILVTLARSPWIENSCKVFFRRVGEQIKRLNVNVVYAQGVAANIDYDKQKMASDEEIEWMYAEMKGKAISQEVDAFYSQYEGQTWKNIISIGDSDFERLGTIMMSRDYMRRRGLLKDKDKEDPRKSTSTVATNQAFRVSAIPIQVNGHVYKVRTKTFKMLDSPTIAELKAEVDLIRRWLPLMVALDDGFDADLSALDDPKLLENIDQVLHARTKAKRTFL